MDQSLRILEEVCRDFGYLTLLEEIGKIRETSSGDETLNIAVFGRFKAGKSTFLNHLFGQNILPAGATPVTNVITHVRYGPSETCRVLFLNGLKQNIALDELATFINEKKNPNNEKGVALAEITLPVLKSFRHLKFIDTPGIGSLFAHNTEATKQWIPGTGVALLAIDPGHPLSEDEAVFLKTLRQYTPDIRILLTKTDLYTKDNLQEVEQFITEYTSAHFEKPIPVYRYSVVKDASRHRNHIIRECLQPLEKFHTEKRRDVNNHKMISLAKECLGLLEITRSVMGKNEEERRKLLRRILDGQAEHGRIRKELRLIAEGYTSTTREKITQKVFVFKESIREKLQDKFKLEFPQWRGNLFRLARKFEQWSAAEIKTELTTLVEQTYPDFDAIPGEARSHFEKYLRSLETSLQNQVRKVLDITFETGKKKIGLKALPPPDVSVSWAFDSNIDLLWFLFPMVLLKPAFEKYFLRHIEHEVEKNLYRLISQLTEKINNVILSMRDETLYRYDLDNETLQKTIEEEHGKNKPIAPAIKKIKAFLPVT